MFVLCDPVCLICNPVCLINKCDPVCVLCDPVYRCTDSNMEGERMHLILACAAQVSTAQFSHCVLESLFCGTPNI